MLSKSTELSLLFKNYQIEVDAQMELYTKVQLIMTYEKLKQIERVPCLTIILHY